MPDLSGRDRAMRYLRGVALPDPAVQGTFVNEQRVATEVGVSRTPVREALLILASEGLVQLIPRRGAYVPPMSARDITELFDLRGLLERYAADALTAGRDDVITAALRPVLDDQRAMTADRDGHAAAEFIELDSRFHQSIIDAADNQLLSRTYAGLRERQLRLGILAMRRRGSRWQEVCAEHTAILDALAAGDKDAARAAIDDHLAITLRTLLVL